MAVLVDNARAPYGRMLMSHMIADTPAELLDMAALIGVEARHVQFPGTPKEHLDVCASRRELAIAAGAVPVSSREIVRRVRARRAAQGSGVAGC